MPRARLNRNRHRQAKVRMPHPNTYGVKHKSRDWSPEQTVEPTTGVLVAHLGQDMYAVFRPASGWTFHDGHDWNRTYATPAPVFYLQRSEWGIVSRLNLRGEPAQNDRLTDKHIRHAMDSIQESYNAQVLARRVGQK